MDISRSDLVAVLSAGKNNPAEFDIEQEADHLLQLFAGDLKDALADYEGLYLSGVGGSGIVFRTTYRPYNSERALKIPRKAVYDQVANETGPIVGDPELHALEKVNHQHITRLYSSFNLLEGRTFCSVTEYVKDPLPLHEYARSLLCTDECKENDALLKDKLGVLSQAVYELASALQYMHEKASLVHFDVKPDNLLVSSSGSAYVTDLGFARDTTKYSDLDNVTVGFTWKYAHPKRLTNEQGRITRTQAKSKNTVKGKEVVPAIDLFAFGRSIQETLRLVEIEYGDKIRSFYDFNFLHMLACLCLDGENAANFRDTNPGEFVSDQALGLPTILFDAHRFRSFRDVTSALERLLGIRPLVRDLPELDKWAAETINVSDLGITTLTPRVKSVIEHPAFERLAQDPQLGMLDTVFPTATHNRFQHSLGVYHSAAEYLSALYYDPDNPIFRILFTPEAGRLVLVAALLHDVGQSTFGHEMEEVDNKLFSHVEIGKKILSDAKLKDKRQRSLKQIIEADSQDCWGLDLERVLKLIQGKIEKPLDGVLIDIIDGQLDADKLDYLVRDSIECRVHYGQGIDIQRFLRSLTVTGSYEGASAVLRLAIKQKGAASAEAFAFARYQLYQSLYWHHTFRSIKSMILTSADYLLPKYRTVQDRNLFDDVLFNAYVKNVLGLDVTESKAVTAKAKSESNIEKRLLTESLPASSSRYGSDRTIQFLYKLSTDKERELIKDLVNRSYYKRCYEVSLAPLPEHQRNELAKRFSGERRKETQQAIEEALLQLLRSKIQSQSEIRVTEAVDIIRLKVDEIASSKHCFLADLPLRGWQAGGNAPAFVSDYKRRYFGVTAGMDRPHEKAALWSETVGEMMRTITFFRVFCEPSLHQVFTRYASAITIHDALVQVIPELRTLSA